MKAAAFEYVAAKSVADAVAALGARDAATSVIAGGQSLVPMLNLRVAAPDVLVDIGSGRTEQSFGPATAIRIGALTTHAEIEDGGSPILRRAAAEVASEISYRAVRNYGTLGGSVALADPAADWPVCLLALGVRADRRQNGVRQEPIGSFLKGQYETSLAGTKSSSASTCRGPTRGCAGNSTRSPARVALSQIPSPSLCSRDVAAPSRSCSAPTVKAHCANAALRTSSVL